MGWLTSLLGFLDKLFAFINTQQLKKAGRDELKVEQAEAENDIRKATKDIVKANAALSSDSVARKLSKYQRKDK